MRFFLDNCLPIRHARALNEILQPEHTVVHLQEMFPHNTKDVDWIRSLGPQGGWIIISGDYRIGKSPHEKAAWHESCLTVFFLAKGWTNITPLLQHSKLTLILEDIIDLAERAKPGTGYLVPIKGKIQLSYEP